MSKKIFPKITFKDKADSWELNDDSKYVLTAKNINEIKDVVNSLSQNLENETLKFSEIYAYLRLIVPENLTVGDSYDILIDISTTMDFSETFSLKLSTDSEKFYVFENGEWKLFGKSSIDSQEKEKSISINIESIIENRGLTYFGRYKFINMTDPTEATEFIGFCLGSYNDGTSKKIIFSKTYLKGKNSDNFEYYSGDTDEYKVYGLTFNGEEVDITNSTFLKSSNSALSISEKTVKINEVDSPRICVINFTSEIDGTKINGSQEIFVHPLTFIEIFSDDFPTIINEETENSINYSIFGKTSNDRIIEIPVDEVSFNFLNCDFISAKNGICKINKSKISKNETIKYLISYEKNSLIAINNVIDIKEIKIDLPLYDTLKIEMTASNEENEFFKNSPDFFCNVEYELKTLNENNEDISYEVEIENSLDVADVSIIGNKIKCTSLDKSPMILRVSYDKYGKTIVKHKYFIFRPLEISDIIISEESEIKETDTITKNLKFIAKYENNFSEDVTEKINLNLMSGNPFLFKSFNLGTLKLKPTTKFSDNLCFKIDFNGFEKLFVVTLVNESIGD